MKKILYGLFAVLIFLSFGIQANAKTGTDITVGVEEVNPPQTKNSNIHVQDENHDPLKQAAIFIETNGTYYLAGTTNSQGDFKLYLIPNTNETILIRCAGYEEYVQGIFRGSNAYQSFSFSLKKIGNYHDTKFSDVRIGGLHMNLSYQCEEILSFVINQDGMENEAPTQGDIRFRPTKWYVINESNGTRSETYRFSDGFQGRKVLHSVGKYRLYVAFAKESYESHQWNVVDDTLLKYSQFEVVAKKVPNPNNPTTDVNYPEVLKPNVVPTVLPNSSHETASSPSEEITEETAEETTEKTVKPTTNPNIPIIEETHSFNNSSSNLWKICGLVVISSLLALFVIKRHFKNKEEA